MPTPTAGSHELRLDLRSTDTANPTTPSVRQSPHWPFVGQHRALQTVERAVAALADDGDGECLVLEGKPGIGKTRLLEEVAARAERQGLPVATGRGCKLDVGTPLSTLGATLGATCPELVDGVVDADAQLLPTTVRIRALVERAVSHGGLVVCLDDLHAADPLSIFALRLLVPALAHAPILWLLTQRPAASERSAHIAVDWLERSGVCDRLVLAPLDDAATAEFCASRLPAAPGRRLLELAARAGGNPLLLEALLRSLHRTGQLEVCDGVATVLDDRLPAEFIDTATRHVRELSPTARTLLAGAAVLGRPFSLREVAGVVGRAPAELTSTVTEAIAHGVLVDTAAKLTFRAPLLREAIVDGLAPAVRATLHREAATALVAEGQPPAEAVEHLLRSDGAMDERALALVHDALARLEPTAPGPAADLAQRVLQAMPPFDPARPVISAEAVRLLAAAGRVDEARDFGHQALCADPDEATKAKLLLGLVEAALQAGEHRVAREHLRQALQLSAVPDDVRAHMLAVQAQALRDGADLDGADQVADRAITLGRTSNAPSAEVAALITRSTVARAQGRLDAALAWAEEAVNSADRHGGFAAHRHPRLWYGHALVALDRFEAAEAVYEVGQRGAEQAGSTWSLPRWRCHRAELRWAQGRLEDAAAEAEAGLRLVTDRESPTVEVRLRALRAQVALRQGEPDDADGWLKPAAGPAGDAGARSAELVWAEALHRDAEGDVVGVAERLRAVVAELSPRPRLLVTDPAAGPQLVGLALRAGRRSLAETATATLRSLADGDAATASLRAAAAHAEGLLDGDLQTLREAVAGLRPGARPLATAAALEDTAAVEADAGRRARAHQLLQEAHQHYRACGAHADEARVQARVKQLGLAAMAESDDAEAAPQLTHAELRVARLVADGLTNRQIARRLVLSPHTVDSHIRHSFSKLGINSRVELTRYVLTVEAEAS